MRKSQIFNVHIFCYFLLKLTQLIDARDSFHERKFAAKGASHPDKIRNSLQNILLSNMGLRPEEVKKSEKFADLSHTFPHFVPDFMKLLYDKYRSNLYNISVEIEGQTKILGPVEMIHCQRLRDIQSWSSVGIHKLIFKPYDKSINNSPLVRELRINKRLFPKLLRENINKPSSPFYMILMVLDDHFQVFRQKLINSDSFNKQGWISIDISQHLQSSVFYIKTIGFWKKHKSTFKRIELKGSAKLTQQLYPYYANIVTFFKNKSPSRSIKAKTIKRSVPIDVGSENMLHVRSKRDAPHESTGPEDDCQRYPLMVTFKEVGWSKWIIAPQNYNAYYCKGNCPYPLSDNFNATNHAIIQLLVHGLKDLSIPKPCCVPYHLHPETLLYLNNEGDALLREFKDMSVSSCSCR